MVTFIVQYLFHVFKDMLMYC